MADRPATAPAVTPRPAATVIVVRAGPGGRPEVFMVRRDPRSQFAADAFVFPGGTVHQHDGAAMISTLTPLLVPDDAHRRLVERGSDPPQSRELSRGFYVAAVRELYEEAGILLARQTDNADGPLSQAVCQQLAGLRSGVQASAPDFAAMLHQLDLVLMPERLVYFSHWITPAPSPRRYDTRFFVVEDRPEQTASHCGIETVDGTWTAPADILARAEAGEVTLVSVTAEHLRVLAEHASVHSLLAFARAKPIRTVLSVRNAAGWDLGGNGAPW